MVLGNMMLGGAPVFAEQMEHPISPEKVMVISVHDMMPYEQEIGKGLGTRVAGPEALATDS